MRFNGKQVERARHKAHLTQADLAFKVRQANPALKPDSSSIGKIERGEHMPGANLLAAIATATGQDIEFFYEAGGDDDEEDEAAAMTRVDRHAKGLVSALTEQLRAQVNRDPERGRVA